MWEVFGALFGGAFWGTKIMHGKRIDTVVSANIENRIAVHNARKQEWHNAVSDIALQNDLIRFIAKEKNYDAVWSEVKEAYQQMPSHQTYNVILLHERMVKGYQNNSYTKSQRDNIVNSSRNSALNIMLARRGKVQCCYASGPCDVDNLKAGYGEDAKKLWDEKFEFWLYIRNELRKHGVDARLIFKTAALAEHQSTAYDADDVNKFRYRAGSLTWLPLTYFDDNLLYF